MTTTSESGAPSVEAGDQEYTERWQLPAVVEAPDATRFKVFGERISGVLGMRAAGWVLLLGVLVVGLAGLVLRWQELRLMGIAGAAILLVAIGFTIGRSSFRVQLGVADRRVVVGEPASGRIVIANAASRRNLPARLDLPIGGEVASFHVPSLAPGETRVEEFAIPTERRAVLIVGPAQSVQGDPFSLTGRETDWSEEIEVFVHPRTVPLIGRQTGFIHDLEGHSSTRTSASDMSFQSLREYAPGDDRRQVHWRSSAHIGQLMVRQFEETLQSRVAVGLDLASGSYLGADDFEIAVSAVGSLALQAVREQNPLTMFTNTETLAAVSGPRALDELSRVERRGRTDLRTLTSTMLRLEPQASVVFVVTGAAVTVDGLRRACATFDLDTRVVGVSVDPSSRISVRNVANVSLVRLPNLDDLGGAMRRAMP